jgi:hypothetical protein
VTASLFQQQPPSTLLPTLLHPGNITCLSFTRSPALSQTLIEGPQHSSVHSFVSAHDPRQQPRFPSSSAPAPCLLQSSLRGYTTCLSFVRSPALAQTLLEGLLTLPRPPRRSPSCDTAKTPTFQQRTGAQHHATFPPSGEQLHAFPSDRISLDSVRWPPIQLCKVCRLCSPACHHIHLPWRHPAHPTCRQLAELNWSSDRRCDAVVTPQQPFLSFRDGMMEFFGFSFCYFIFVLFCSCGKSLGHSRTSCT